MVVRIDDILDNPFRLLGLGVGASSREVTRASDELCTRLRIRTSSDVPDLLSWVEPLKVTEESATQSRHTLQDAHQRAVHEFFWFWFRYPNSDEVRAALLDGDPNKAAGILCAEMEMGDAESATNAAHDLGLVRLIAAGVSEELDTIRDDSARALGLLLSAVRELGKGDSVSRPICEKTLGVVVERVRDFVDSGKLDSACSLYNVLLDCPYDDDLRAAACRLPFRAYFESVISRCDEIVNALDVDKDNSAAGARLRAISDGFERDVLSQIDRITDLCEFYVEDIEPVCDAIIDCGHPLSVRLHNELDDSKWAYEILHKIELLPASEWKIQSMQEDIRVVRKHALIQDAIELEGASDWSGAAKKYREALTRCDADDTQPLAGMLAHCEMMARLGCRVKPVESNPSLETWNGLGCKFYGCTNQADDGSYVTTHWLVVLFLPIIALSRYLVRPSPSGGWYMLGKLPLLRWQKYYSIAAVLAIVIAFVAIGISSDSGSGAPHTTYSQSSGSDSTVDQSNSSGDNKEEAASADAGAADYTPVEDHSAEIGSLRNSMKDADQQLASWKDQLATWSSEMDQVDSSIESLKSEKESIEQASARGDTIDEQRYDSLIEQANSSIRSYNALKDQHNALVKRYNRLVKNRNAKLERLKALEEENQ